MSFDRGHIRFVFRAAWLQPPKPGSFFGDSQINEPPVAAIDSQGVVFPLRAEYRTVPLAACVVFANHRKGGSRREYRLDLGVRLASFFGGAGEADAKIVRARLLPVRRSLEQRKIAPRRQRRGPCFRFQLAAALRGVNTRLLLGKKDRQIETPGVPRLRTQQRQKTMLRRHG